MTIEEELLLLDVPEAEEQVPISDEAAEETASTTTNDENQKAPEPGSSSPVLPVIPSELIELIAELQAIHLEDARFLARQRIVLKRMGELVEGKISMNLPQTVPEEVDVESILASLPLDEAVRPPTSRSDGRLPPVRRPPGPLRAAPLRPSDLTDPEFSEE